MVAERGKSGIDPIKYHEIDVLGLPVIADLVGNQEILFSGARIVENAETGQTFTDAIVAPLSSPTVDPEALTMVLKRALRHQKRAVLQTGFVQEDGLHYPTGFVPVQNPHIEGVFLRALPSHKFGQLMIAYEKGADHGQFPKNPVLRDFMEGARYIYPPEALEKF